MDGEQKEPLQSSLRVQELIYGLRISEVMTSKVFAVSRNCTMRDVQTIMKNNSITGVPVVDNKRVVGIITMNDLMNALEQGAMEEGVTKWMVGEVQTLAEEMPLSFAISAFGKFSFRQFPVVNKKNELTGILTFRNINHALIRELSRQLREMEQQHEHPDEPDALRLNKVYQLHRYDFENGGKASSEIKKFLKERGIPPKVVRRVAVASYELEINLVAHSIGGMLGFDINTDRVKISSHDRGPGIEDTEKAMTEGYSTANEWIRSQGFGAGMGLPNVKRVSDEFAIESAVGMGTMVQAIINLKPENVNED
ncbi:Serine/threonine-protein kinase RsbT [Pontiella desulfatans]|uniref:Serine/threonine-protein kinase RsbT n=1 Tax=Pontiella desulfatans TaxID=2750659 RepID=A0A6C2UBC6_PONDE|nr:CBS domain-containing protein [Pontiella desulfatans]VGO16596.1 Serine/threonine-protein kinase RsbT [Pontiella desulfatans]